MSNKPRLELTWIGKDQEPRLEARILIEDASKSFGDPNSQNILVRGDNLLALKALEQDFANKIKCIYIDPPYNTGSAFQHYDDGIEHSLWLSMMRDRLLILHRLLRSDGALFVQIDDNEGHYLKVLLDEIFGRNNFVTTFIWQKVDSPNDNKVPITPDHEFVHCYAKDRSIAKFKPKFDLSILEAFQVDENGRRYRDRLLKKNGRSSLRSDRPTMFFPVTAPDGTSVLPIHDDGREARWALSKSSVEQLQSENKLIWKNRGSEENPKWIPYTREYAADEPTRPYPTIWTDVHTTRQAKAHQKELLSGVEVFATPKPEPLIKRILDMITEKNDWVLDSFAGSGTTGAVAHKMSRRWIMVELGEHCESHVIPRLKKIISGDDSGGITEDVEWDRGGGFKYYDLAPSLLKQDSYGNWIIEERYNAVMLAAAVAKHEGFRFSPHLIAFWKQGFSTERDFIYVTTQFLTLPMLEMIHADMARDESLLICCKSFQKVCRDRFPNITVKKIPQMLLGRCEFGKKDEYQLRLFSEPTPSEETVVEEDEVKPEKKLKKTKRKRNG